MHRILDSLRSLSDFSWASWMNKIPKIVLATLFLPTISDEFVCWSTMNTVYLYKQKICVIVDKHFCSNSFIFSGNIERWLCSQSYNYQFFLKHTLDIQSKYLLEKVFRVCVLGVKNTFSGGVIGRIGININRALSQSFPSPTASWISQKNRGASSFPSWATSILTKMVHAMHELFQVRKRVFVFFPVDCFPWRIHGTGISNYLHSP